MGPSRPAWRTLCEENVHLSQQVYEGFFLLDSNRYAADPTGTTGIIEKILHAAGAEILVSRMWDERRLAYPVKGHKKGVYWLTYFKLESTRVGEITRAARISDEILRSMVTKPDARVAETLVEHARSGTIQPSTYEPRSEGEGARRGAGARS